MEISELHQDHGRDAPPMTARQRFIVVLLLGASFMLSADFSILNVALPEVGQAIGLKVNEFPWIATSFALPAAGLSLLLGGWVISAACAECSFSALLSWPRPRSSVASRPSRSSFSQLARFKASQQR